MRIFRITVLVVLNKSKVYPFQGWNKQSRPFRETSLFILLLWWSTCVPSWFKIRKLLRSKFLCVIQFNNLQCNWWTFTIFRRKNVITKYECIYRCVVIVCLTDPSSSAWMIRVSNAKKTFDSPRKFYGTLWIGTQSGNKIHQLEKWFSNESIENWFRVSRIKAHLWLWTYFEKKSDELNFQPLRLGYLCHMLSLVIWIFYNRS